MTEWREWDCWRRLNAAAMDRLSGAATVGESAARALHDLVESAGRLPDAYPRAVEDALQLLLDFQPAMAPVTNLANTVYLALPGGPEETLRVLDELAERLAGSSASIGRKGATIIPAGSTVLTHSSSTTVRTLLVESRRTRRFRVCCTEALPEGEGVVMAADLAAIGFEVEVIPDDVVVDALPAMDVVMVGADAIGSTAAINKVGTMVLVREARRLGIPFYIVASREKVLPAPLFERAASGPGRDEFFEVIPLAEIEAVVTEEGPTPPARVADLVAERPVASQLVGGTGS